MCDWVARTKQQQEQMRQLAQSGYFEEGEGLEELLGLISILVDFCYEIKTIDIDSYDQWDVEGNFGILFANVDTFIRVCDDYSIIKSAIDSQIEWGEITTKSVKQLIDQTYDRFEAECDFHMKVRYLLDLFKMSLVFAGLVYGNPKD